MTRMQMGAMLLALVLLFPALASADCSTPSSYARFNVSTQYTSELCTSFLPAIGVVSVQVTVTTLPASKVRLSLPNPPFGLVGSENWLPHTGDRLTGMEFDLGCTGPQVVYLGGFSMFVPGPVPCTTWQVDADCEVEDCDGRLRVAESIYNTFSNTTQECVYCFQQCKYLPVYDLYPAFGATQVPLNVELSFDIDGVASNDPQASDRFFIDIGTDPNCSNWQTVEVDKATLAIALNFLQPGTKYYWVARWFNGFTACAPYGANSEVHEFTTAGVVGTQAATWGKVKSMYRD